MPYKATLFGVMGWAKSELNHVGRITAVEDPDIQYSYALSTVNGMMHLRQALEELVNDEEYDEKKGDLQKTHDQVVRVLKHLIKDYDIDLNTIKAFNTRHVLKSFNFLNKGGNNLNKRNTTKRNNTKRNNTKRNKTKNNK